MIVEARSLFFRYPGTDRDTLKKLDFAIREGELLCLLGRSGSGKSTLLALLAGLFQHISGSLCVAGHELPRESAGLRGAVILVPQNPDTYILGSLVKEDLLLGLEPEDEKGRERALELTRLFELHGALAEPVHTLSHGQKRKLCLASALASKPRILLLDEPFAGLDHPASMTMREILTRNKTAKLTQVVTGHDLDLMADIADSFMLLQDGEIFVQGDAGTVFPHLVEAGVRPPCWWYSGGGPAWLAS